MSSTLQKNPKHRINRLALLLALVAIGLVTACKKDYNYSNNSNSGTTKPGDSLLAPLGFSFQTTKSVSISVNLASNNNQPITGIPVSVYTGDPTTTSPILTAVTDMNGLLQAQVNVPAYLDTLIIDPNYVGLIRNAKAIIGSNNTISGTIGGSAGYSGSFAVSAAPRAMRPGGFDITANYDPPSTVSGGTTYSYMGSFDNSGVPTYLVSPPDAGT